MRRSLFFCGLMALCCGLRVEGLAQQGSPSSNSNNDQGNSSTPGAGGKSSPNTPVPNTQAPGAPSSTPTKAPVQPPASSLSPDLSFPGDGPAQPSSTNPPEKPTATSPAAPDLAPPRSDRVRVDDLGKDVGQSSSKDTQEDLAPPEDDAKAHPKSAAVMEEAAGGISAGGVSEFKQWSPQKAAKDIEVGDFYFKRRNYKAAEERYREALTFKENDAMATFKLAVSLEKLQVFDDARLEYESYLKILPHGPEAGDAEKALERLKKAQ